MSWSHITTLYFLPLTAGILTSLSLSISSLLRYWYLYGLSSKKFLFFLRLLVLFSRLGILLLGTTIFFNIARGLVSNLLFELSIRLLNITLYLLGITKIFDFSYSFLTACLKTYFLKINKIRFWCKKDMSVHIFPSQIYTSKYHN